MSHLSTGQYAPDSKAFWVSSNLGLITTAYRTHTMRPTKVQSLIYKKTKNLRAVNTY